MINNRQGSRRRGRGGSSQQRPSGGSSGQRDSGNRIDSRARGNAAQLLEKYKNMARDAQMSGDRVQVEYYLQFADHYFRVLADSRARSDDHRPIRPVDDFDGSDEEYGDEGEPILANEQGDARQQSYQQNGRNAQQPYQQNGRDSQQPYQQNGRDGQQPRRDDARRDDGRREESRGEPRRDEPRRDEPRRDDRPRRDYQSREEVRADEGARDEQPATHANGYVYRERVANDLDEPTGAPEAAASTARRPSRTRAKSAPLAAEGLDAERLPPSLGISARAEDQPADKAEGEVEDQPKPKRRRRSAAPPSTEAQTG